MHFFFFLNQTVTCPPDAVEAEKEPICLMDLWRVSPCGRDCNTAVIPQQPQGAASWTRCVGFKGSKQQPASHKEKCWSYFFLKSFLLYWHDIYIQMHIIRLQEERQRITLTQLRLLKFTRFRLKQRNLCLAQVFLLQCLQVGCKKKTLSLDSSRY